jgi:hypothetical protein
LSVPDLPVHDNPCLDWLRGAAGQHKPKDYPRTSSRANAFYENNALLHVSMSSTISSALHGQGAEYASRPGTNAQRELVELGLTDPPPRVRR